MQLKPIFSDSLVSATPLWIAGPCSAESREQVLVTARQLRDTGIGVFRAGVWKPRTKPGCFEGLGKVALPWLREVEDTLGMQTVTEVANAEHVREALAAGLRAFWVGARTSANPFAVQEIADELSGLSSAELDKITVLVKNPVNPDIELWIGALERLAKAGVTRLGAIHRGFSSYSPRLYRNLPEWRIPIALHSRIPQLPLICDPSHIGGSRTLVAPLSQQALDMRFDGLMIEVHPDPDHALSDGGQQITPDELMELRRNIQIKDDSSSGASLVALRQEIDGIDDQLMELLARRMAVAREIGEIKRESRMPVVQPGRYSQLMESRCGQAGRLGLSDEFVRRLFESLHEESVRQQMNGTTECNEP